MAYNIPKRQPDGWPASTAYALFREVGMLPFTAYFTEGDATAYDLVLPKSFKLSKSKMKLDALPYGTV